MSDAERQQQRAIEAIAAINAGADPAEQAAALSNEFTDRQTSRAWAWLRRVVLRRR